MKYAILSYNIILTTTLRMTGTIYAGKMTKIKRIPRWGEVNSQKISVQLQTGEAIIAY